MRGSSAKSGRYHYYQCKKAEKFVDGGCSQPRRIGRELLNKLVIDRLAEVVFEPMRLRSLLGEAIEAERAEQDEAPRQLNSLLRRKAELDTRLARLYTAIQLGKISVDDPVLEDQVVGLKGERSQIEIQSPRCGRRIQSSPHLPSARFVSLVPLSGKPYSRGSFVCAAPI